MTSNENVVSTKLNLDYYMKKYVAIIGAYIFVVVLIAFRKNKFLQIINLFTDKWFIATFLIMIIYIIYAFSYSTDDHFKDSVMAGFTAFVIAFCAKLDLIFIPFFIIFSLHYYVPSS